MSSTTNTAINSRSMNGVITISDGEATLENGDLNCNDIVSDTLTTTNLISTIFTCNGEIRSNLVGPYTIPVSTSALTGSLISYGNTSNSGATDFTNYGSTYNLLKQGFYFNNINSTTTLTNLAIIDNSQTYFKSQLVGCTAETPLNTTSIVNKTYCDSNFVDRANNLTQDINGVKTFTTDITVFNAGSPSLFLKTATTANAFSYIRFTGVNLSMNNQNPSGSIFFQTNTNTRVTINSTQLLLSSTTFLTTNDMKSRAPADAHSLLTDITTGTLSISSATATNTINGATQLNQQTTFNNFTPICSVASPTAINHLTRKDYVDNNFVDRTNNLAQGINGIKTFSENVVCSVATPTAVNHLTRKDYVDNNFLDRVNNLTQSINGAKTFTNNTNITASLLARTNIKLSEYENTPASNNVTLSFPLPETIALRTTALTNNNMTVTLPALSNNERGYVFTFNKIVNPTYGNFNVIFQTSGGNYIFTLLDQAGTPTSNTTLLSIDKIQCKIAVGFFGATNYWIEQTDFSTYDRFKLQEWQNATTTNSLTLAFPLPPTIALRASTASTMTITLPTLTTNDRGKILTFVKLNTFKFDVTFNTSGGHWIFPLNNISGTPTTNTTIFPSTKTTTRLAVGWSGVFTYWIEVSDYSTFDQDENNLIYPRLAIANVFTNTNIFNAQITFNNFTPISSVSAPTAINHLTRKDYVDSNFMFKSGNVAESIFGVKTFGNRTNFNGTTSIVVAGIAQFNGTSEFNGITTFTSSLISNNITTPLITGTNDIYTTITTGTLNISSSTSLNNIFGATIFSQDVTFDANLNIPGSLVILDGGNFSTLTQTSSTLNIENPSPSGSVKLRTQPSFGIIQDTFTSSVAGNTSQVDLTCSASLISNNLTSPSTTSTNSIYTSLVSGGVINFGSTSSTCNFDSETIFNSDVTIGSNIYCDTAIYFKDIGIGSQSNQARIVKLDDYLFFDTNIDYTNGYVFRTSSINIFTITQTETTTNNQLSCNSSLYLRDSLNQTKVQQVNTDLEIQNEVVSGAINFSTTDSSSSLATRASILEDQFYFQVPLTISIGASLYSSFTSTTIGYKTSNTGSSQTLTSTTGVNSGQLVSLDAGVWKIDYTATITITAPMSVLTTLEVFLANSANVDLDIQGLDVINFYNVAVTPTKKIKISASGTLINSGSPSTYNLRLIPVFTAGGGNFVGSISATRLT